MTKVASQSLAGRGNQRTVASRSGMSGGYEDRRSAEDRSMRRPTGWNTGSKRKATVAAAGGYNEAGRQSKGYVMKCYYCKELHEGGWQKCAKMKKNDPN